MSATGDMDTYTFAGWVGTLHTATMVDLKASTIYYYRVGDGASSWSEVFHFTTLTPGASFTAAVIADMGYGEASDFVISDILALVEAGEIQAVVHSGDISYADGENKLYRFVYLFLMFCIDVLFG
jgi:phosphodiesterase/alkaline phosphatase D-like protein